MGILETILRSQCDISDRCRQLRIDTTAPASPDIYDFIVVGSGAAGSAVAARLSENPAHRVLLLEAGGHEPIGLQVPAFFALYMNTTVDWRYRAEPNANSFLSRQPTTYPRGRLLGGSTSINGMLYMRGTRADFDGWAALGNHGWSFDDVLPYFRRAEDYRRIEQVDGKFHATGGPVPVSQYAYRSDTVKDFMRAALESGFDEIDLNGRNSTGAAFPQSTIRNGVRVSAARAYLHPAWQRPNLHIRIETMATKVLIDPQTKHAYGVTAIDNAGRPRRWLCRKEVIISAGAIESPKLLMNSGIGPAEHLIEFGIAPLADRRGVGENLQNHVHLELRWTATNRNRTTIDWLMASEYVLQRGGELATLGSVMHMRWSSPFANRTAGDDLILELADNFRSAAELCSETGEIGVDLHPALVVKAWSVCQHPQSRGRVRLGGRNPLRQPRIYGNDLAVEQDVDVIVVGVRRAWQLMRSPALSEYGLVFQRPELPACEAFAADSDDYWHCVIRQQTGEKGHSVGTCKMGTADDPMAVVDSELRVWGVSGLRVVDASVMPLIVAASTMATTTMIGEKGAQSILETWA